jgi:hypothetical protein
LAEALKPGVGGDWHPLKQTLAAHAAAPQEEDLTSEQLLARAWQLLRGMLDDLRLVSYPKELELRKIGALYVLRKIVGEVHYNVLHGDCRRQFPLEGQITPAFKQMTSRMCDFVTFSLSGSLGENALDKIGELVIDLAAVIGAVDRQAIGAEKPAGGAHHG